MSRRDLDAREPEGAPSIPALLVALVVIALALGLVSWLAHAT